VGSGDSTRKLKKDSNVYRINGYPRNSTGTVREGKGVCPAEQKRG